MDTSGLCGIRRYENHSASLGFMTQPDGRVSRQKTSSYVGIANCCCCSCGWQIAVEVNGVRLLLTPKCSRQSYNRAFTETLKTICGLPPRNNFNNRVFTYLNSYMIYYLAHVQSKVLHEMSLWSKSNCLFPVLWSGCDAVYCDVEAVKTKRGNESSHGSYRRVVSKSGPGEQNDQTLIVGMFSWLTGQFKFNMSGWLCHQACHFNQLYGRSDVSDVHSSQQDAQQQS